MSSQGSLWESGREESQSLRRRCGDRSRGQTEREICRYSVTGFEVGRRGHEPRKAGGL